MQKGARMVAAMIKTAGALNKIASAPWGSSLRVWAILDCTFFPVSGGSATGLPLQILFIVVICRGDRPLVSTLRGGSPAERAIDLVAPVFFQLIPFFSQVLEDFAFVSVAENGGLQRTPAADLPIGEEGHEAVWARDGVFALLA